MNAVRANATLPSWFYTSFWQAWLVGLALFVAFPELRAGSQWLGAGWFWCLLAPATSWLVLYRQALLTSRRRAAAPRSWHRPAPRPVHRGH